MLFKTNLIFILVSQKFKFYQFVSSIGNF